MKTWKKLPRYITLLLIRIYGVKVAKFCFVGACVQFAGLIDLAISHNSLIGGDDFKSGQTKIKSVLVDFLVGAGIKVYNYFISLVV